MHIFIRSLAILLAVPGLIAFNTSAQEIRAQLNEAIPLIEADRVFQEYGIRGYDVGVLVIDNFDDRTCIDAPHGKPVAEIVERVAPSSRVYFFDVGVLDPVSCQTLPAQKILQGLFAAVLFAESRGVRVINMSFGIPDTNLCNNRNALENAFIDELAENGIILVAAAGNDGKTNSINHPACLENVISVGAVYDKDGAFTEACEEFGIVDWLTCFSNRSAFLDVVAPGSAITTFADPEFDGTSAASPIVSGIIAMMLEANPKLTTGEITEILKTTGDAAFDPVNQIHFPRVNAYKAVQEVLVREGVIDLTPPRPGLGLSGLAILDFYDFNDSRSIDDDELFLAVDDWIVENITDREFFIVLDSWILDLDIERPESATEQNSKSLIESKIYDMSGKLIRVVACSTNSESKLRHVMRQVNLKSGLYILETRNCHTGVVRRQPIARVW